MTVKMRFAGVVSDGLNILHKVPSIKIMVRISPVTIPVLMAFLITQNFSGEERIFLLKIGIIYISANL